MNESASIEAIKLARAAFSSAQGDYGLIKFSVEELAPSGESGDTSSKSWDLICSFYENLGSTTPTTYKVVVNLNDKTVAIKKIGGGDEERKFTVLEDDATAVEHGITPGEPSLETDPPVGEIKSEPK